VFIARLILCELLFNCGYTYVSAADGSPLPASRTRRIGRGNLEIRNIVSQDAGLYRCSLAGELDSFAEAMLSVHGMWSSRHMTACLYDLCALK